MDWRATVSLGILNAMSPLAFRVAELRKARGWTQEELAERAGVGRVTIARIESGKNRRVDLDVLERLAAAFDVGAGYLIRDAKA